MVRRRVVVTGTAALLAALCLPLTACSNTSSEPETGSSTSTSGAPASSEPAPDAGAPLDGLEDDHGTPVQGAGQEPGEAAATVVATWARPQLSAQQWWSDLEPMLSASAQQAYGYTDPTSIPALQVLSTSRVRTEQTTPTYEVVDVKTTSGTVRVNLTRTTVDSGWVMDRMDLSEVLSVAAGVAPSEDPTSPDGEPSEGPIEFGSALGPNDPSDAGGPGNPGGVAG
jgi:hypothetical protein